MRPQIFERLHRRGIETVTLCLDNDDAGRAATARAVEQSARARESPCVYVVDPKHLAPAKDPDEFVRPPCPDPDGWSELIATRMCGVEWRARELMQAVTPESRAQERRAALTRAGRWLGTLPPRLAVEAEAAIHVLAEQCGHSPEAASRAFRARFWRPEPDRKLDLAHSRHHSLER
jgi:DNA primase